MCVNSCFRPVDLHMNLPPDAQHGPCRTLVSLARRRIIVLPRQAPPTRGGPVCVKVSSQPRPYHRDSHSHHHCAHRRHRHSRRRRRRHVVLVIVVCMGKMVREAQIKNEEKTLSCLIQSGEGFSSFL